MTGTKDDAVKNMDHTSQYSQDATYAAEVVAQELDGNPESPQVRLDVKLLGKHRQAWRPDKGMVPFDVNEREVKSLYLTVDRNKQQSYDYTLKDLRRLGFTGMNFSQLVPDAKGKIAFSLVGKVIGVKPRIITTNDKTRVYWNPAIPDSDRQRPTVTREQFNKFLSDNAEGYAEDEAAEKEKAATEQPAF